MPKFNSYGNIFYSGEELFELLHLHPDLDLSKFTIIGKCGPKYIESNTSLHTDLPNPASYLVMPDWGTFGTQSIEGFDHDRQIEWNMPNNYKELDIAKWVLDQCKTDAELQRVGEELILYQERDLFDLLRFLKYLVDTMRENNIVWGVGRGSSVASYVLFLIGIHKIDSMYYELDIREFLHE